MKTDRFDKILWLLLGTVLVALTLLLWQGQHREGALARGNNRAMERELANQARVVLLQKLYGPVEELRQKGELQNALLKLDELSRQYPGEAHGYILQGEILQQMGVLDAALASYVAGIRLNGTYVDRNTPLSQRDALQRLVAAGERDIAPKAKANPNNRSLATALANLNYLKSRLAGGCE
ncbi:MAG: hypothetical protein CXR30_16220 [Geobacter sp.]|nr:MAG: hypothetical protein CXR30_16220 [Geobacter sp.]